MQRRVLVGLGQGQGQRRRGQKGRWVGERCRSEDRSGDPRTLPTHCPRLGGTITLSYCLAPAQEAPCERILDCWWQVFDIHTFLKENVSEELLSRIGKPPREDRLSLILRTIETLKKQ